MTSRKQEKQRRLAWKLKMVTAAQGTLYPREDLPGLIHDRLRGIVHELHHVEMIIRYELRTLKLLTEDDLK
jgi:hypothetical protein